MRAEGEEGNPQTFIFFVEELSFTLCESTSNGELVCELGVRFADCGNGDVIAGREGINGRGRWDETRQDNEHALSSTFYRVVSKEVELTVLDLGDFGRVIGSVRPATPEN